MTTELYYSWRKLRSLYLFCMFRCLVTVIKMWRRDHPRANTLSYHSSNVSVWLLVVGRIPLINHETLTYSGSTLLVHLLPKENVFLFDSVELSPLINNAKNYVPVNPSVSVSALMTLIDFTLSNARRFYSSMGNSSETERFFLWCETG